MNVKSIILELVNDDLEIPCSLSLVDIVKDWLEINECDGLFGEPECGCSINELFLCGQISKECVPAMKKDGLFYPKEKL